MEIEELLKQKREEILRLVSKHGAGNVRIFGSTARGEAGLDSDVDFLVQVIGPTTPWFPVGLILDLEELLGCKVDVLTEDSVHWLLRRRILKEAVSL